MFFGVLQRVRDFAWLETTTFIAFSHHKIAKKLRIASKSRNSDAQSSTLRNISLF